MCDSASLTGNRDQTDQTLFFTGHRRVRPSDQIILKQRLQSLMRDVYQSGYRRFFCGCALGFDMIAANETLRFRNEHPDISLILAIPCETQPDQWSEKDQAVYRKLLLQADEINILSPIYYPGCMHARNQYMADRSSLCICYLLQLRGGTASTVRYAVSRNIQVINLALPPIASDSVMKEPPWNYISTSHSAKENAVTVPLYRLSVRKLRRKHMYP